MGEGEREKTIKKIIPTKFFKPLEIFQGRRKEFRNIKCRKSLQLKKTREKKMKI